MKLLIDFETRSRADLATIGQHIYATHPSTEVICLGWKVIGEKKAQVLTMPQLYAHDGTKEFLYAVKHAEHFVAHNAAFEQAIWNKCLVPTTKVGALLPLTTPDKWICTLSYCSILNLPRGLEKAAVALKMNAKKDVEGRRLLLQMCKPRRPINDIAKWIEWVETDEALKRLYKYCEQDLWAEEELYLRLNKYKPFTESERALWILDQRINQRGFQIDQKLVARVLSMIKLQESRLHKELQLHTFGWVKTPKQVKNFRAFLEDQGFYIPNLQAKTVDQALKDIDHNPKNENVIRVLKIRQELGKSSTSKYEAFKNRCDEDDGRIRDNLLFHGASTGRWSGVGVQPQNFPRGTIKINQDVLKDIMTCDLDELRMLYGNPSELFSSALRSVITASDGKELFCADFSSIEARVLLWVAGDTNGLKEYEAGLDTYLTMAGTIYQMNWKIIEAEYLKEGYSEKRQIGKKVILACGYQMGLKKFIQTCKDEGIKLPDSVLTRAHAAFKQKYPKVPETWTRYEKAAIYAVLNKGKKITVNKVTWYVEGEFLFAELPSGRRLAYYGPQIKNEETPWGEIRPKLYHWTVDSKTKQWVCRATYGGMLTENIVQAISRDCMVEAMVRCEDAGFECLITVHDENLSEIKIGQGSMENFKNLMSIRPDWGQDIPLKVGAWFGGRYKK